MNRRTTAAVSLTSIVLLAGLGPVTREGEGSHRATLNAMEARAFPADALAALDVAPGGVTVYVTMSQSSPESLIAMRKLNRLEQKLADQGLKVIGVVDEASWDAMKSRKQAGFIKSDIAKDVGGAFRSALHTDDEPDVYVRDRAGQLRYADVDAESIEGAIEELLAESKDDAAGELARREAATAAGEDPFASPARALSLDSIPASAYANANWPKHNAARALNAADYQGKKLPVALGKETWLSEKDREPAGHVLVLDFWATWCGPCIASQPTLEKVQKQFKDEVMVLAIAGSGEDQATVERFLSQHHKAYYNLYDAQQSIATALRVQAIPHSVIVSTDGVVRWQGNPLATRNFDQIVAQIVAEDPYIKAAKDAGTLGADASGSAGETGSGGVGNAIAKAYAAQKWPEFNTGALNARNVQGQTLEDPFAGVEWLDGDTPDFAGKITIVDFWATWCGPCRAFSPTLDAVQKRFKDDVVAVGLSGESSRESRSSVVSHIEEHPVSYRHAFSSDRALNNRVGVAAIPHVLILSSDGVVRWQGYPGDVDFQGIVARIVMADRKARAAAEGG